MRRIPPLRRLLFGLLCLGFGLLYLAPVLWMLAASLKPDARIHADVGSLTSFLPLPFTLENYAAALRRSNLAVTLVNTFIVTLAVSLGGLLVNAPAAYALARMRFPGREALFLIVVATIVIPIEVIVIPLFLIVRESMPLAAWLGQRPWTLGALSLPFLAKAFNIFLLRQYFLSLPRSVEEAAFIDGVGWWGAFWRVALPNAKPALATVVILDFVIHWNDFLWPLVIAQGEQTRTIQLGLGNFFTQPPISWGAIMAYALLASLPLLLIFAFGQKWIVASFSGSGIKE